jgi:hypothetical protein
MTLERENFTMTFKNGYRLWDQEFEKKYWTPDEIADNNAKVARICSIIDDEQNGLITHDEALIRHLMLDTDLAQVLLDDAYEDGSPEEIKRVQSIIGLAKARTLEVFASP